MEDFNFYIERKCTVWERESFSIAAESKEEALKEVMTTIEDGEDFDRSFVEEIYETIEYLSPSNNKGFSTTELYDTVTEELIWENGK